MSHKQFFVTLNSLSVFRRYLIKNLPDFSNLSKYYKGVSCTEEMSFGRLLSATIGLVLCCFTFQADAQSTGDRDFVINGTIAGVDSGIIRMLGEGMNVKDSAVIVKGKFVLTGKISSPERKVFNVVPGNWTFRGFVDAPVITFNIDTLAGLREHYKDAFSFIYQIEETGSPMADVYREYENAFGLTDYSLLIKKLNTAQKDSLGPINNKMKLFHKLVLEKQKIWTENYIRKNPASPAGVYIFNEYYHSLYDKATLNYLSSMIKKFSGAAKTSSYYKELSKQLSILKNVQTSKPAPDFTLLQRDNSKLRLSTTRGSVIMLDFWASWCVPCRAGIPHWKKVYAKYHRKNFNIISISNDRYRNSWVQALDQEKMPWTQVIDKFPSANSTAVVSDLYGVPSLPFFVLISEKGEIILASGDERIMTRKIDEIFKKTTRPDNYDIPSLRFHSRKRATAGKAAADSSNVEAKK